MYRENAARYPRDREKATKTLDIQKLTSLSTDALEAAQAAFDVLRD
jgi:hypothetical protein